MHDQDLLSIQEVRSKVEKAHAAAQKYGAFTQEQVDRVVERMAEVGRAHAQELAEMAVEETGMGNVPDKMAKNLVNADLLPRRFRGMKTVGVLRELPDEKVIEIGVPVGVVAAVVPTTNPTSTVIFKALISLKAGNAIVISPHPRAMKCTCYTADLLYKAALEAGAPEDIIQCISSTTLEATQEMMRHKRTGVILATGGSGMVRAAYSSGKPAFGVGPGNVAVLIDTSADIADAVTQIVIGKAFDYGTVCSSEQVVVAERSLRDQIISEFKKNKAYFADESQSKALEKILFTSGHTVNPACVGQSPQKIAQMAGFTVPDGTSIICCEIAGVGRQFPLSAEKLSPVLSLHFVGDFNAGLAACEEVLRFGGLGHTTVIYSRDDSRIRQFGLRMPAFRVLVNTAAPYGSTGVTTNVFPSMTLGCGAMGGNVTGDNVGPQHLINTKRIAYVVRTAEEALPMPPLKSSVPARSFVTPSAPVALDRQAIAAAVEQYLASRGISVSTAPAASVIPNVAAQVVDRFLGTRTPAPSPPPAQAAPLCPACATKPSSSSEPGGAPPQAPPAAAPAPEPQVPIVDFVCEADVRAAVQAKKKIYIGPKTIVTPSAREIAASHDVLVIAAR